MKRKTICTLLVLCLLCTLLPVGAAANEKTGVAYPVTGGNIYFDKQTGAVVGCDELVTRANIPAQIDGVPVTSFGYLCFSGCDRLQSISIPATVRELSVHSIGCWNLRSIQVDENNPYFSSDADGVLFDKNKTRLICCPMGYIGAYKVPEGVATIGEEAFNCCDSLTELTLPDSLSVIESYGFGDVSGLKALVFPENVVMIGDAALYGHNMSLYFKGDAPRCSEYTFSSISAVYYIEGKRGWTEGRLYDAQAGTWNGFPVETWDPAVVTPGEEPVVAYPVSGGNIYFNRLSKKIERSDPNILRADIPAQIGGVPVTGISDEAFRGCFELMSVTLPETVKTIGFSAFFACTKLKDFKFNEGLTTINSWAFRQAGLQSAILPDSLISVGSEAFAFCEDMTAIRLGPNLTEYDMSVFRWSDSIAEVTVDDRNPAYAAADAVLFNKDRTELIYAFGNRAGTYRVPDSVLKIDSWAFEGYNGMTEVILPEGLLRIEDDAFALSLDLKRMVIPASVTYIGARAIPPGVLEEFSVDPGNTAYCSVDGVLFDRAQTLLVCCALPIQGHYTIPDTVKEIGGYAFYDCEGLTGVTIPDGVKQIDYYAFYFCQNLKELTIPDSVEWIGMSAFDCCQDLRTVHLGKGLRYLDYDAFDECFGLEYVTVSGDTNFTLNGVFSICPNLKAMLFEKGPPEVYYWDENISGPILYYAPGTPGWTTSDNYNAADQTFGGYRLRTWDPSSPAGKFLDVDRNAWYHGAVEFAAGRGLFNGTGEFSFSPESTMTRAMLVTVLWRSAGEPKQGQNSFRDVPDGTWYTDAVAWAAANGIVNGVGDGRFSPDGTLTREQLAAILMRYSRSIGRATGARGNLSAFPDGNRVSAWAGDALAWAVGEGLVNGSRVNGKDYLRPQGSATRAQVATILMRFLEAE